MTIDVIEAPDGAGTEMVRRVPSSGSGEFKLGAQVVVRESQTAIFFRDGRSLDTFGPGRHALHLNLPLLGGRITDRVFGQSPFKAEVYFVNQNVFLNVKWGTRDPIAYRDRDLALVRLRAHGELAVRVTDPVLFVNKVVGVRGLYTPKDIEGFLKSMVVSTLAQVIGGVLESIFDLLFVTTSSARPPRPGSSRSSPPTGPSSWTSSSSPSPRLRRSRPASTSEAASGRSATSTATCVTRAPLPSERLRRIPAAWVEHSMPPPALGWDCR